MPEKKASDIIGKHRVNYDRAIQAIKKENYDYAIELLGDLIKKEPTNLDVRMNLRRACLEKSEKKGGFFQKIIGTAGGGHHLARSQLALKSDPIEALTEAELMLISDPKSITALKISAEAAEAAGFPETHLRSLVMVHRFAPADIESNRKLANLYCDLGLPEKAEQVFAVLLTHYPDNQELMMESKNISARRTMKQGGYEDGKAGGSFHKALRDSEEAKLIERERRMHKDEDTIYNLLAEYERRFETESQNVKLVKDIAELYALKKDYYRAIEYYNHLEGIPDAMDSSIEKTIAETKVKCYEQAIAGLNSTDDEYETQKAAYEEERDSFRFDNLVERVRCYPTDMNSRFDLGIARYDRKEYEEAIKEFQRVKNFPRLMRKAVLYLARCFAARDMTDMAISSLLKVVEENAELDDERKELIYTLALIYEQADRMEDAIGHYKTIYEVDIGFRDVADKVENHYRT